MSVATNMVDALRAHGLRAYLPGMAEGICSSTYYVVIDNGRRAVSKTNALRLFTVTAVVPASTPGTLDGAIRAAREALLGMPNLNTTGDTTDTDYDEAAQAVTASIEYTALCAI